ncbi:hypothetical protein GCM10010272_31120 [Streptomyces lateritius]|nr:hypothetical protein GCM10010272_31120 [Streptomyces lateritius]
MAPAPRPRPVAVGPNGWPLESATDASGTVWTRQVPGSSVAVALRLGEPAVVLVHVIRRYHYEIDTLTTAK